MCCWWRASLIPGKQKKTSGFCWDLESAVSETVIFNAWLKAVFQLGVCASGYQLWCYRVCCDRVLLFFPRPESPVSLLTVCQALQLECVKCSLETVSFHHSCLFWSSMWNRFLLLLQDSCSFLAGLNSLYNLAASDDCLGMNCRCTSWDTEFLVTAMDFSWWLDSHPYTIRVGVTKGFDKTKSRCNASERERYRTGLP